jgi:NADP-dependent 3-hydroxy acid dehydrogenase YdfG
MRRVPVTGAASGIGAACVHRFQNDGSSVAALDRNDPVAERKAYEAMQLHSRLVTAEEIAGAVACLADPDGGYIVG